MSLDAKAPVPPPSHRSGTKETLTDKEKIYAVLRSTLPAPIEVKDVLRGGILSDRIDLRCDYRYGGFEAWLERVAIEILEELGANPHGWKNSMKCTAHIRREYVRRPFRCERELGHPGLHRYTLNGNYIQEFTDGEAYFPFFRKETENV